MQSHAVMFHHFHSESHPKGQGSISAGELEQLIRYVGEGARIVPAAEWLDRASRGTLNESDVCLSFDDSLRCQYDVAYPVISSLGLTAFWFVYTSPMEGRLERLELYRYFRTTMFEVMEDFYHSFYEWVSRSDYGPVVSAAMSEFNAASYLSEYREYTDEDRRFRYVRDEVLGPEHYYNIMESMIDETDLDRAGLLARLWMDDECILKLHREGHVIGMHSHTHPTRMTALSAETQEWEYSTNHRYLKQLLGVAPVAMSHPCNSYNHETLHILQRLGVTVGFRSLMNGPRASSLEYPREDHMYVVARMKEQGQR